MKVPNYNGEGLRCQIKHHQVHVSVTSLAYEGRNYSEHTHIKKKQSNARHSMNIPIMN